MQLATTVLAIVATASAADLRNYFETNCGGGYVQCGNVGSGTCCYNPDYALTGFPSVAVVYTDPGTQLFGYQTTRDGNYCGAIAMQQATGDLSYLCISLDPNRGTFAASRWYPGAAKARSLIQRENCPATASDACTGLVLPDTIVLNDGHSFNTAGLGEADIKEFVHIAASGITIDGVPEKFKGLGNGKKALGKLLE